MILKPYTRRIILYYKYGVPSAIFHVDILEPSINKSAADQ